VGLAIGFAFKNILENYLAGILLSTSNPFDLGDVVEIRGNTGKVALLTARDTVLVTLDGNHLRIPNSIVINSELLNFTRNPRRRFEFLVGVSVDLDVNAARRIGLAALAHHPGIVADPKPIALIDNLGDSTVNLKFLAWMDQTKHDFAKSRSEAIRLVKEAFDREGIEMPEPIYRIQLRDAGALHADKDSAAAAKPARAAPAAESSDEITGEDVSADDTIDRQIAEEQRDSEEENLLPPPGQEEGEKR
jgi:small-conductance mechanosensitive channel